MRRDDATKELFLEALELGEADRARLVADLRAARPASAERLERLLSAHAGPAAAALEGSKVATLVAALARDGAGQPGAFLADYELEEEIASGASGVVWRARQRSLGRSVALKVLRAGRLAGAREIARFRAEAELIAALAHPNIVPVYEVGEHEGRHFFSMRYYSGGSLAERIGPEHLWPPRAAAELVATIARAVQHAHQRGLLHRDLKPSNVLLDEHGAPCVADFGIARPIDAQGVAVVTETLAGTPAYMAPEQTAPGLGEQTVATDVWALGCILYELLAGRSPFADETDKGVAALLRKVREEEPFPLRALRPDAPGDLETIALACLAKEPARRYASAEAVAVDLERWLAHEPILARRTGILERTYLAWRRNPLVASLAALVLLLVVALAVGGTWASVKLASRLRDAYVEQARATRRSETPGRRSAALALLARANAIRPGPDLRDEAIASLALTDLTPELAVPLEHVDPALQYRLSPSLRLFGMSRPEGGFDVIPFPPSDTGENRAVLQVRTPLPGQSDQARCMGVRFSPDERFVYARFHSLASTLKDASFGVWDLTTGALVLHADGITAYQAADFHPDGTLLVGTYDGRLLRYDLSTGERVAEFALGGRIDCLRFSSDGSSVAIGRVIEVGEGEHDRIEVRSADDFELEYRATLPERVYSTDWTRDGELLAACGDFNAYVFDRGQQEPRLKLSGHSGEAVQAHASKTDALAFTTSWDGTTRLWSTDTGEELLRVSAEVLTLSADGKRLAVRTSEEIVVWRVEHGEVLRTLRGHTGKGPEHVAFSRDGTQFVSSGLDGAILWQTQPGKQQARLVGEKCDGVQFTPDGQRMLIAYTLGLESRALSAPEVPGSFLFTGVSNDLALRDDGRLAVLRQGRTLHFFDPDHPEAARSFPVLQVGANEIALSQRGTYVAVGAWKGEGVTLVRTTTGEVLAHLMRDQDFTSALVSPDEGTLVLCDGYRYEFLSLPDLQPRGRIAYEGTMRGTPIAMAYSPDGERVALALDTRRIGLYDARTLTPTAVLESPRSAGFWHLVFSPDGRLLVSCSPSNEIRLWDLVLLESELERHGLSGR